MLTLLSLLPPKHWKVKLLDFSKTNLLWIVTFFVSVDHIQLAQHSLLHLTSFLRGRRLLNFILSSSYLG